MSQQTRILTWFLLIASCLISSSVGWSATDEEIQKKIDQTKKQLSQTKMKENTVLGSLLRTQKELDRITANVGQLSSKLGNAERRISEINQQLNAAQRQLDQVQSEILGRQEVLDQRLIAIYKYGYHSYIESLYKSRNFGDFIYRFEMVSNFVKSDVNLIKTLQEQQELIAEKRAEITKKQQELEVQKNVYARLHNQTKQEQDRRLSLVKDKQRELAQIQDDRALLEQALDELELTSKNMESQIRSYQNKNRGNTGTGRYIWPAPGSITSYFGYRYHPILRKRKYHTGLDIGAPMSTKIMAADSGTVIFSGTNGGYGKMISLDHGNGFSTVYGHCSALLVGEGQSVTKGQTIGLVGSTGFSTGPHLAFRDPQEWCPGRSTELLIKRSGFFAKTDSKFNNNLTVTGCLNRVRLVVASLSPAWEIPGSSSRPSM